MLEVCFNDSVKGALKMAQHCTNGDTAGAMGVILTPNKNKLLTFFERRKVLRQFKKEQAELKKQAVSLGGNSEDVLGISLCLSEGDVVAPIELEQCPRKDFIYSWLAFNPYGELEELEKSILEFWSNTMADLQRLKQGVDKARVWVDQTPEAACGLLFVADLLVNTDTEIHIVSLPKECQRKDKDSMNYWSWSQVPAELFGTFLEHEKILTKEEVRELSLEWKRLQSENAPLRVVEKGKVISVLESYYDDLIRKEFPKETCRVGELIGRVLGNPQIPTRDVFIAKRIKCFIQNGELELVSDKEEGFYSHVIQTVK